MDESFDLLKNWVPPVVEETEYRLYYTEAGKVDFYTCEKPAGKFIVIDQSTYSECRYDLTVVDGAIVFPDIKEVTVSKLVKSDNGTCCLKEDVSIVVKENNDVPITKWKIKNNVLT